jgi:hypothetical protein
MHGGALDDQVLLSERWVVEEAVEPPEANAGLIPDEIPGLPWRTIMPLVWSPCGTVAEPEPDKQ